MHVVWLEGLFLSVWKYLIGIVFGSRDHAFTVEMVLWSKNVANL